MMSKIDNIHFMWASKNDEGKTIRFTVPQRLLLMEAGLQYKDPKVRFPIRSLLHHMFAMYTSDQATSHTADIQNQEPELLLTAHCSLLQESCAVGHYAMTEFIADI